jgi:hypothetical protein
MLQQYWRPDYQEMPVLYWQDSAWWVGYLIAGQAGWLRVIAAPRA